LLEVVDEFWLDGELVVEVGLSPTFVLRFVDFLESLVFFGLVLVECVEYSCVVAVLVVLVDCSANLLKFFVFLNYLVIVY
jgi:hypothetical protein